MVRGSRRAADYPPPPRGGDPKWRPSRPWRYVVAADDPSVFSAARRTVWHDAPFRIQEAPELDVTPYVTPEGRHNWRPGDQIAGPVELVVANRGAEDADARLELALRSLAGRLTVMVGSERRNLAANGEEPMTVPVRVPPGGTAVVTLDPGPPQPDGAPVVALTRVAVR